jgi:predicted kinase
LPLEGPEGYVVGYQMAPDNLRLGLDVVADSVNPLQVTRRWSFTLK